MHHATDVLRNHPGVTYDLDELAACLTACHDGAAASRACADACLSEDDPQSLARCIRMNLDCAVICDALGSVVGRGSVVEPNVVHALLEACERACAACARECERFASLAHCRACAEACRRCEQQCRELAAGLMAPA